MKKLSFILCLVVIISLLTAGCSGTPAPKGLLQGKVYIGPLSPVVMPGEPPPLNCAAYDARKIMIYDKSGSKLIQEVDIECNSEENYTRYRVELDPGTYTVDINRIGIDYSDEVPRQVEILSDTTFKLDIDIDTGIR